MRVQGLDPKKFVPPTAPKVTPPTDALVPPVSV